MTRWPALVHAAFSLLILAGGWLLPAVPEIEGSLGAVLEFAHEHGPDGLPELHAGSVEDPAPELRFGAVRPSVPVVAALDRAGDDKGRGRVTPRRGGDGETRSPFRPEAKPADRSAPTSATPLYLEVRSFLC